MEEHPGDVRPTKPLPQHWMTFSVGRANFYLGTFANTRDRRIGVYLIVSGPDAKAHYHLLHEDKDAIERELGQPLEWRELPDRKESHIALRRPGVDLTDKSDWPSQHTWLHDVLNKFHRIFRGRVRRLDASDWSETSR